MAHKLPNYLRTYRKRSGLSQSEAAFLLGCSSGTKVCYYEHADRLPSLETVLAYEKLFGIPARELFAGLYEKVDREVMRRSRVLAGRLKDAKTRPPAYKMACLTKVTGAASAESGSTDAATGARD